MDDQAKVWNMQRYTTTFKVNGSIVTVAVKPTATLLDVLRTELGLTGTKRGCDQGDCGACTVILEGKTVNSCLVLAMQAAGKEITTVEGLGTAQRLHPLQEAFVQHWGFQCGFCTPGMLLSAKALLDENPSPSREEIKEALSGNLCRCTGYAPIIQAIERAAKLMANQASVD